jgi:hypothetical protein
MWSKRGVILALPGEGIAEPRAREEAMSALMAGESFTEEADMIVDKIHHGDAQTLVYTPRCSGYPLAIPRNQPYVIPSNPP